MMVWKMILYVKFLACTQLGNNNCSASMIVLLGIHGWSIRYHPKGFTGFFPSTLSNLYDINIFQPYLQPYIISYQTYTYINIKVYIKTWGDSSGKPRNQTAEVWRLRRCLWWQRWKYLGIRGSREAETRSRKFPAEAESGNHCC